MSSKNKLNNSEERILGLDIGVTSLGWAVSKFNKENHKMEIEDFGVRIWEAPEESKTLNTNASKRREFRSQRRLGSRRKQRIKDLKNIFYKNDLLSEKDYENHLEKIKQDSKDYLANNKMNPLVLRYRGLKEKLNNLELLISLIHIAKRRGYSNAFLIPGLTEEKDERESRERINKIMKDGGYKYPIQAIMEDPFFNFKNPSKFMYRSNKPKTMSTSEKNKLSLEERKLQEAKEKEENKYYSEHQVLFNRENYIDELDALLDKQTEFNPKLKELKNNIKEVIFRQRNFEDGPGPKDEELRKKWEARLNEKGSGQFLYKPFKDMIGKCQFFKEENRITNLSIEGDISFILNETSKLFFRLLESKEIDRKKIKKLTEIILKNYFKTFSFKRDDVSKFFKEYDVPFPKVDGISFANSSLFLYKLYAQKDNRDFLIKNIKNIDIYKKDSIIENKINKLGKIISETKTPKYLKEKLFKLDKEFFDKDNDGFGWIRKNEKLLKKDHKTLSTSSKFILKALSKQINEGILISEYQSELIKKNRKQEIEEFKIKKEEFLKQLNDPDMRRNGVVFRSINQTRKVVRKIFEKYNYNIDKIIIEVAKDLYAEEKKRKFVRDVQRINEDERKRIESFLISNEISPSFTNVINYKIFKQQQITPDSRKNNYAIDLYDIDLKEKIGLKDFFIKRENYDVDHIIPYSIYNDNTIKNKVITKKSTNNLKGNKTPLDYFATMQCEETKIKKWKTQIVKAFRNNNIKLNNLLTEKFTRSTDSGFESRNINDTRYITKYISAYFELEFDRLVKIINNPEYKKPELLSIQGGITSKFRKLWLNPFGAEGSLWGHPQKPREISPFHHAIDAMILTNMISKQHIEFYQSIVRIFDYYNWLVKDKKYSKNQIAEELKIQRDLIIGQLQKRDFRKIYNVSYFIDKIDRIFERIFWNIVNKDKLIPLYVHNDKFISAFLKPFIEDIDKKIDSLIPVELEKGKEIKEYSKINFETGEVKKISREVEVPKFKRIIDVKKWSDLNNKDQKEYPFVSYKINKRVRGNFLGSENPVKKRVAYKDNKLQSSYIIDRANNIWDINKYYGFKFEDNKLKPVRRFEVLDLNSKKNKENQKNKRINTILSRNVTFEFEGNIYKYNGTGGNSKLLIVNHPNILYNNEVKFKNNFNYWPRLSVIRVKKIKILNINLLGKVS